MRFLTAIGLESRQHLLGIFASTGVHQLLVESFSYPSSILITALLGVSGRQSVQRYDWNGSGLVDYVFGQTNCPRRRHESSRRGQVASSQANRVCNSEEVGARRKPVVNTSTAFDQPLSSVRQSASRTNSSSFVGAARHA